MMYGSLLVQSFAARLSSVVPGVQITLEGEGQGPVTFFTDAQGIAEPISLPAPDKELSLDENNTTQPYSLWNLVAEKNGYQTITMNGIQVFACETALIQLEMLPSQRLGAPQPQKETFDIPPHSLYGPGAFASTAPRTQCPGPWILTVPIIPKNITVHLGKPKASARNVTVSFRKYIANVASSEVYPTWPEQALRANIHAQISLALNRVYTEWYPSKGYPFNITNSTSYDQYYVHGRNIFPVMERLTDEIFNTYVRKLGTVEPFYTEYCDGKSVTCKGMKQWGTVDRAREGKNALEILKYYYGQNIEIVRTTNIQGIPESYPGQPLRRGDTGTNVRVIQRQLSRIAKDYPFFGNPGSDGIFGAATERVVKAFQKQFNLTPDGIVGRSTWYKISYIYASVKDLAELTSEGEKPTGQSNVNGSTYPGTPLRVGSRGNSVEQIQFWLQRLARFNPKLSNISVDGIFGNSTEAAVKAFQREFNLPIDGIVGPNTWRSINRQYTSLGADVQSNTNGYPGSPVREGSRGDSVRSIQFYLRMAASNYSSIPKISVDGIFGSATTRAVKAFQQEFGLSADGVVGKATWQKLYEIYGDIADRLLAPNQRPGTYPGTVLRVGSTGRAVREAQFYLSLLSVYYSSIPNVSIDGIFGASTAESVKAFQKLFGLPQDGLIGSATWSALYSQSQKLRSADGLFHAFYTLPWPGFDLAEGAEGINVTYIQFLLRYISYFYDTVQAPDEVTGIYEEDTARSVESWQLEFDQPVTGRVDEFTWNALTSTFFSLASGGSEELATDELFPDYPGYVMGIGSAGGAVLQLQQAMNGVAIRYCVADFVPVNGIFAEETEQAVIAFQEGLNLPQTGVVDEETWNRIFVLLN